MIVIQTKRLDSQLDINGYTSVFAKSRREEIDCRTF